MAQLMSALLNMSAEHRPCCLAALTTGWMSFQRASAAARMTCAFSINPLPDSSLDTCSQQHEQMSAGVTLCNKELSEHRGHFPAASSLAQGVQAPTLQLVDRSQGGHIMMNASVSLCTCIQCEVCLASSSGQSRMVPMGRFGKLCRYGPQAGLGRGRPLSK